MNEHNKIGWKGFMKIIRKTKTAYRIFKEKGLRRVVFVLIDKLRPKRRSLLRLSKRLVIKNLKNFSSEDPESVFDFVYYRSLEAFKPMQIKSEFLELLKIFKEHKPKVILEIGTANGGTLFCFCKLAPEDATIISIDLPQGSFGGGYPEWKTQFYQSFKKENQIVYLLRKDSHLEDTLKEVKRILGENKVDFLFIDADHFYNGVRKDFELYSPLVKKNGIIAFHDIAVVRPPDSGEVNKFWEEIKRNYEYVELIKDYNQNWAGIGLIKINSKIYGRLKGI